MVPGMMRCFQLETNGCDEVTVTSLNVRYSRLMDRLGGNCPEAYCDECKAHVCLINLRNQMQYSTVDVCRYHYTFESCLVTHINMVI